MQIKYWRKKTLGQRTGICCCLFPTHWAGWMRAATAWRGRYIIKIMRMVMELANLRLVTYWYCCFLSEYNDSSTFLNIHAIDSTFTSIYFIVLYPEVPTCPRIYFHITDLPGRYFLTPLSSKVKRIKGKVFKHVTRKPIQIGVSINLQFSLKIDLYDNLKIG